VGGGGGGGGGRGTIIGVVLFGNDFPKPPMRKGQPGKIATGADDVGVGGGDDWIAVLGTLRRGNLGKHIWSGPAKRGGAEGNVLRKVKGGGSDAAI